MYVHVNLCVYVCVTDCVCVCSNLYHTLASSTERVWEPYDLIAMSTTTAEVLASPVKVTRAPGSEGAYSKTLAERVQMILEHLIVAKNKEVLKE